MKKVLFATTALAGLAIGGVASAQGIALFGDARLGLGYNINNEGGVLTEFDDEGNVSTPDDFRAISRVRFGVNMTGETDSGITFGATIRADNAQGGQGGTNGQTAGSVFVSGSWGTLTYGDTNGADEQWVGDVPGDYSVTGLGELDETRFVSNGGSFGADSGANFADNPFARPTIRYDFDIMGFGVSASSNRDLTDIAVGTGYSADFGGGSWSVGVGYNSFESFTETGDIGGVEVCGPEGVDDDGECIDTVLVNGADVFTTEFPSGEQWSVGLDAEYEAFGFGATWVSLSTDDNSEGLDTNADNLLVGASFGWDAWSFGAVFGHIMSAGGTLEPIDGNSSYEFSAQYDLGGGASFNAGVRQTYNLFNEDGSEGDSATIGDLGIVMAF
jgi:outer membrane protein OmpU